MPAGLFSLTRSIFGNAADTVPALAANGLTSIAVDWRFAIPQGATATLPAGNYPVVYVGGAGGVFRSLNMGQAWTDYPDTADGGVQNGGLLPDMQVTALQLITGNVNASGHRSACPIRRPAKTC